MARVSPIFLAAALGAASSVHAEEATPVEELVVTATRVPTPLEEAPGVRVIGEGEIEARQAVFAADLLDTLPGVSMSRNGGLGGVTGVRIRGAASDQTLVVIDGVPLNDPADPSGGYDFANLDLAGVARVEVLSGPQGAAWGSDAMGGVVSITTREPDGWRGMMEGGSYGTARAGGSAGVWGDRFALGFTASAVTTDGFSKAAAGTEADAYAAFTAGASGRYRLADNLTVEGRVRYNEARVEIDGFPPPAFGLADTDDVSRSRSWSSYARATYEGGWRLIHQLTVAAYDLERESRGESGDYPFSGERRVYRYTIGRGAPSDRWSMLGGVEREETSATLSTGEGAGLDATAAFATTRLRPLRRLSFSFGLRYDDPSAYGPKPTVRAASVLDLGRGFALQGSWGQGYKTPSISQIACDFCFPAKPAAGLRPETAEGYDLGLAWRSADGRLRATATGFRLDVRDQIAFVFDPTTFESTYANLERTYSGGVEMEAEAALSRGFTMRAAYSYTEAEDATTGAWLIRVPRHQGSAVLSWRGERLSGALTVRAEGAQADVDPDSFAPAERDGFVTADLAGAWRLRPGLELTGRVENLFEADYQQALGYGEVGLSAFVGLRLRSDP
ncbi:MAG TPA: TonB-dependent receptor [Caulobacteraceae bacterium]|jgi:vitamin B12 transporter